MLSPEITELIVERAKSFLGHPYKPGFKCMDFVRKVYATVGLTVPPVSLNISEKELNDPPVGFVLFLKRKLRRTTKPFSHVAIILPGRKCIHASFYFGEKVVITDIDQMLEAYDLASTEPVSP